MEGPAVAGVVSLLVLFGVLAVGEMVIFVRLPDHRIDTPDTPYAAKLPDQWDMFWLFKKEFTDSSLYDESGKRLLRAFWMCVGLSGVALVGAVSLSAIAWL